MESHAALLVMDLINEIVHPDGKYAGDGYYRQVRERKVLEHAAVALDRARTAGIPVIHVVVGFSGDYAEWPATSPIFAEARADRRLVLGTWATEIHDAVRPLAGEPVVAKHRVSPFHGTPLEEMLHALRADTLLLAGVTTDLVVLSAAREAHDRDYRVEVLADATATADDALHEAALTLLARTATVTTVEQASPWRNAPRPSSTDRDPVPDQRTSPVQDLAAQQSAVPDQDAVMPRPARRFAAIEPSATFAVLEMARELRAEGIDVLDLGGGEPDFPTPEHITAAAVEALRDGRTHYTPSRGLPELRAAIAAKLAADNGIRLEPATDVIVTPSAKHALFLAMLGVLDPGDEIILPAPCWVSYPQMARLVGARPVFAETRLPARPGAGPESPTGGFEITGRALRAVRTDRTRAVLINTPGNPTGHALDAAEAREIADFAVEHDLIIITDEIYEMIRYRRPHLSMAAQPGCAERTLTVNGLSKAHAMTGWRLGYLAGPAGLVGELVKAQQHTVGCAGSFVQAGGVAALTGPQDHVAAMTAEYAARAAFLVDGLDALPGVRCAHPDGAFYAFPDISGTGFASSAGFADWLLRTAAVAVTPGSAFGPGGEGHVRLSFATSPQILKEALDRMAAALRTRTGRY